MSSRQVAMCWSLSPFSQEKLLLHLSLSDSANDDGIGVDTVQDLSAKCHIDEEDAISCIKIMESTGILQILHKMSVKSPEDQKLFSYQLSWGSLLEERDEFNDTSKAVGESIESLFMDERPVPDQAKAYVYLLKCGEYFKVGMTTDVDRRISQLSIQLPHKPEVIHTIETNVPAYSERFFHEKFSKYRLNGEWFQLDDSAIGFFRAFIDITKDAHGVQGYHYLTRVEFQSEKSTPR